MLFSAPRLQPGAIFGDMTCLSARDFEFGQHPKVTTSVVEKGGEVFFLETASVFDDEGSRFLEDAKRCRGSGPDAGPDSPHFRAVSRAGLNTMRSWGPRNPLARASAADMDALLTRGAFPAGVVEAVFDQALTLVQDFEPGAGNLEHG